MRGTCADDLFCEVEMDDSPAMFAPDFAPGICRQKKETCCERKVARTTGTAYNLDNGRGGFCLYGCAYRKEGDMGEAIFCFMQGDTHVQCQ